MTERETSTYESVINGKDPPRYNIPVIHLAHFGMHLLDFLFFAGLAGSAIVVVLSFIEDLHELKGD